MQNQNLAVKSKFSGNGQICVQNAEKALNLSESRALPKDQILARSSRASSSQNRSQILNSTKAKTSSENPTQSPKNRSNLISLNAAKGSCFSSGAAKFGVRVGDKRIQVGQKAVSSRKEALGLLAKGGGQNLLFRRNGFDFFYNAR